MGLRINTKVYKKDLNMYLYIFYRSKYNRHWTRKVRYQVGPVERYSDLHEDVIETFTIVLVYCCCY